MRELALPEAPAGESAEADAALVREAQRNPADFAALYRRYVAPIHRYLYSRLGNAADAEDVTAEVFSEALRSLPRYQERGAFAAWLFTIGRRKAADHRRHKTLEDWRKQWAGAPVEVTIEEKQAADRASLGIQIGPPKPGWNSAVGRQSVIQDGDCLVVFPAFSADEASFSAFAAQIERTFESIHFDAPPAATPALPVSR